MPMSVTKLVQNQSLQQNSPEAPRKLRKRFTCNEYAKIAMDEEKAILFCPMVSEIARNRCLAGALLLLSTNFWELSQGQRLNPTKPNLR